MARPASEIIVDLEEFQPADGNWLRLEHLLAELFQSGAANAGVETLLRIFERFPNEDGAGVFWSIVHGLESLVGYEAFLVESIRRAPSDFGLMMLSRLINAGTEDVGGTSYRELFVSVARDDSIKGETRALAERLSKVNSVKSGS
jgi:hypothetical protein